MGVIPVLILIMSVQFSAKVQSASISSVKVVRPPPAKYASNSKFPHFLPESFEQWTDDSDDNLWEHTGYLEGDIMAYAGEDRNGILNKTLRWPDAVVPFYIDEDDFSKADRAFGF